MALTITEGYTWGNGATVTPTRLNNAIRSIVLAAAANKLLGTSGAGTVGEIGYTGPGLALLQAADAAAQRTALALGTAATTASTAYDAAGAAAAAQAAAIAYSSTYSCQRANNLNDIVTPSIARNNLGLGTAATHASTDFEAAGAAMLKANNLSDLASVTTARNNLQLGSGDNPTFSLLTVGGLAIGNGAGSAQLYAKTTDDLSIGTAAAKTLFLVTNNVIRAAIDATGATSFNQAISAVAFNVTSARRTKKNIRRLRGALEIAMALRPVSYDQRDGKQHLVGFIADDVNKLLPALVSKDSKGRVAGLDYGKLTAVLAGAVQELSKRLLKLEARA